MQRLARTLAGELGRISIRKCMTGQKSTNHQMFNSLLEKQKATNRFTIDGMDLAWQKNEFFSKGTSFSTNTRGCSPLLHSMLRWTGSTLLVGHGSTDGAKSIQSDS